MHEMVSEVIGDSELLATDKRILARLGLRTFAELVGDLSDLLGSRAAKAIVRRTKRGYSTRTSSARCHRIAVACVKRGLVVSESLTVYENLGMVQSPAMPVVDIDILEPWCIAIPRDLAQVREYERWAARYRRA